MVGLSSRKKFRWIVIGLMLFFFYFPIVLLVVFSFNEAKSLTEFTGFSLKWYQEVFKSREMLAAIQTSVSIALVSTAVSTVVGTISAIGLSKSRKVLRDVLSSVNNLPVLNPDIVTAIGMMLLFVSIGLNLGYVTMLIAHITFSIPYVILAVLPKIRTLDSNITDAAMDLGATPMQALFKVILPQITPAIVSGALIAFSMSIDDFVISYFVSGNGVKNISMLVYSMAKRIDPSINALSSLVIGVITLVLIVINIIPVIKEKTLKKQKRKVGLS